MSAAQTVVFRPHPGKQSRIFTSGADELLAGGGKKSGKTAMAVGRPLRHVADSRFRCVIVRKTIPGLRYIESQAKKLYRKLYGTNVEHNKIEHLFTFWSGAQIQFTQINDDSDLEKIEGWGYQMLIVDEARQYADPMFIDTLAAELYAENDPGTGKPWMKTLILLLTNPGGAGGTWLMKRFAIDKYPKGGVEVFDPATKRYREYVHMTVYDNPSMDAEKYIAGLRRWPLWKQRQMIDGDWFQRDGSAFEEFDPSIHCIDSYDHKKCDIYTSCDWGFSTTCAVHWWAVHPDLNTTVCIDEMMFSRTKPRDVARAMKKLEEQRNYKVVDRVMGKDAWHEDTTGLSPAHMMMDEGILWRRANDERSGGYMAMCARFKTSIRLHDGSSVPSIRFVRDRCPQLIRTLPILPQKPGVDDVDKDECKKAEAHKGIDHAYDSARYHVMTLPLPEIEVIDIDRFGGIPEDFGDKRERSDKRSEQRGF